VKNSAELGVVVFFLADLISVQPMVDFTVGDEKFFHRKKESVRRVG
jgi:hypothetical protein